MKRANSDSDDPAVADLLFELLGSRHLRLTPVDLVHRLQARCPDLSRRQAQAAIKRLVAAGELVYTNHLCTTHIELGRLSASHRNDRFEIIPTGIARSDRAGSLTIRLNDGIAFGGGDHPTTCLCLRALMDLFEDDPDGGKHNLHFAVDIGTGSGVLAIAAASLGAVRVLALDIDPLACHEAHANVMINQVQASVTVVAGGLEAVQSANVDLFIANLRPPTLKRLFPVMRDMTQPGGTWILSGFRLEEVSSILAMLDDGQRPVWSRSERGWSALAVRNTAY